MIRGRGRHVVIIAEREGARARRFQGESEGESDREGTSFSG